LNCNLFLILNYSNEGFLIFKKGGNEYIDEKWREIGIILFEMQIQYSYMEYTETLLKVTLNTITLTMN
jgi:hypothetical protein